MKILALGTSCVDVFPQKNVITPGGEALNGAVHLSLRKDTQAFLMGMIGRDVYGDVILHQLENRPINKDCLYQVEGETANHVIMINKKGDRFFEEGAWNGGVRDNFTLNDNDRDLILDMDGVMTTQSESTLDEMIELKKKGSFLLAVDFNEERDFSGRESLIDRLDIFFSSAREDMKQTFREWSGRSLTLFVLTFGEKGSAAYYLGKEYLCPAVKVDQVVDTTGCGDCFQAHFLGEYVKTGDIQVSLEKAARESSQVTSYVGGFPLLTS